MKPCAILATGPSMNQETADYVRMSKCEVIAVSDAFRLAPWASYLVSADSAWWRNNPDAMKFKGEKFCRQNVSGQVQACRPNEMMPASNSGIYAMLIARQLGYEEMYLFGFDMHGTHFFGKHPRPLKNTTEKIFEDHLNQFRKVHWHEKIINCTPGSRLTQFPIMDMREALPC
jgi:hypothetical protein